MTFNQDYRKTSTIIMDHSTDNNVETPVDSNETDRNSLQQDPDTENIVVDEETASCSEEIDEHPDGDENENLFVKLKNKIGPKICLPEREQQTAHFSHLPIELVFLILTYAAPDLYDVNHLKILDQFGAVCRGWYVAARDATKYRRACSKLWTDNDMHLDEYGGSWRRMLIERPPIFTFGCYVASIRTSFYYVKFFPDGRFAYLVSDSNPDIMIQYFKRIEDMPHETIWGDYEYYDNLITSRFTKSRNLRENNLFDSALNHSNCMVFKVFDLDTKRNWQLKCEKLEIIFENGLSANVYTQTVPSHIYHWNFAS